MEHKTADFKLKKENVSGIFLQTNQENILLRKLRMDEREGIPLLKRQRWQIYIAYCCFLP
jgi:hypothetical protein